MPSIIVQLASSFCMKDTDPMALVTAYFDDSGTHLESDVAVAACFISDVRRWALFEKEWKSILSEAGILQCGFHMADFVAHRPPVDTWEQSKRDEVCEKLIGAIGSYAQDGMATAVVKSDYDRLVTGRLREMLGRYHYTFAVQSCLAFIERLEYINSQPVQYIFDRMGKGKGEINALFDDLIEHQLAASFGMEPAGWSFQNREVVVQLQASDILAWEAYKYMKDCQFTGKQPRKSFASIIKQVHIETRFFDGSTLPGFVSRVAARYEKDNWSGPRGGFFPNAG